MHKTFTFHITYPLLFAIMLIPQQTVALIAPDGIFEPPSSGYMVADYGKVFDGFNKEGITIEIWFYLKEAPSDVFDRRTLIGKKGGYSITVRGRATDPEWNEPEGTIHIRWNIGSSCANGGSYPPDRSLLERWLYNAYQIKSINAWHVECAIIFGDEIATMGCISDSEFSPSNQPLLIGGGNGYGSIDGWIDEVRISRGWRYIPGGEMDNPLGNPPRHLQPDKKTIALWRFDEGAGAQSYADSSGNGYNLFAGGTLAVKSAGKTATVWGRMKTEP